MFQIKIMMIWYMAERLLTILKLIKNIMNIQTKPEVGHMLFIRVYTIDVIRGISIRITMIVTMEQPYVKNGLKIRNCLLTGI